MGSSSKNLIRNYSRNSFKDISQGFSSKSSIDFHRSSSMDNLSLTCAEIPPLILTEIYLKVFVNFIKISSRRYSKDTPRNLSLLFLKHFTKKHNEFHHDFSEISQKIFSMSYKSLVIKRFPWKCLKEVSGACSRDSTRDFPRNFSRHYYKEFL